MVTRGRIAALLELGAGFNPEFSGRENVYLNGEIMGLSRAAIDKAMPSIEAFAEIGEFIERPVKEYSSGMYVRLAFSTAIHVDPEILIVDEALAVGDAVFANRCVRKFQELRERKITVLFVSHDLGLVKQLSDRAILLLNGRIDAEGAPKDVINRYIGLVLERQESKKEKEDRVRSSFRHGDGTSEILAVEILQRARRPGRLGGERRAGDGAGTLTVPRRDLRPDGGDPDPHAHRHGRLRHEYAARARRTGRLPGGRRTGSGFPPRVLAHAATVHPDGGDAERGRHQPRLAGRRHCVRSGRHARCRPGWRT